MITHSVKRISGKRYHKTEVSPWGATVLFVKKKDKGMRQCIDHDNWIILQLRVDTLTMERWII